MMHRPPLRVVVLLMLAVLGCARHHVIPRDQGRVDGAKSIGSTSDLEWRIHGEPAELSQESER